MNQSPENDNKYYLTIEYVKEVYKEEVERRKIIDRKATLILAFILGIFTSSFFLSTQIVKNLLGNINFSSLLDISFLILIILFFLSFILSFVFTLLVLKVRNYEALNDLKDFEKGEFTLQPYEKICFAFISDYVIATTRNRKTNDIASKHLRNAWLFFYISLTFLWLSIILRNISTL